MGEKKVSEMTIRLSDTLKRDAQDVAMYEDRKLSDIVRIALEVYIYGHKHRVDVACSKGNSGGTTRGYE